MNQLVILNFCFAMVLPELVKGYVEFDLFNKADPYERFWILPQD